MKNVIIYHSADLDGIASGQSIKHLVPGVYPKEMHEFVMIGWNYGEPITDILNDILAEKGPQRVYITDICFPATGMKVLASEMPEQTEVYWIDHHKSSIQESEAMGYNSLGGLRRNGTAACRLVWEFFGQKEPRIIELLGKYDVFEKDREWDTHTVPCQNAIFSKFQDITDRGLWGMLFECDDDVMEDVGFYESGRNIQDYLEAEATQFKANCFTVIFEGLRFIARNGSSGSGHFCWMTPEEENEYDGMMVFRFSPSLDGWRFSLYGWADHSPDLSVTAKRWEGGGHPFACGFEVTDEEMCQIIGGQHQSGKINTPSSFESIQDQVDEMNAQEQARLATQLVQVGVEAKSPTVFMVDVDTRKGDGNETLGPFSTKDLAIDAIRDHVGMSKEELNEYDDFDSDISEGVYYDEETSIQIFERTIQ